MRKAWLVFELLLYSLLSVSVANELARELKLEQTETVTSEEPVSTVTNNGHDLADSELEPTEEIPLVEE